MSTLFTVGSHVTWNFDGGQVTGKITKIHHQDFAFMGRIRRASKDEPQYEVESDKTGRKAAHKGDALASI